MLSTVNCVKTAEHIEMPFGMKTWVGTRNHVVQGDRDLHGRRHF